MKVKWWRSSPNGNEIYSRSRPGEKADFEEALEALVGAYPNKDAILKTNQVHQVQVLAREQAAAMPLNPLPNAKLTQKKLRICNNIHNRVQEIAPFFIHGAIAP